MGEPHEIGNDDITEPNKQDQHRIRPVRERKQPIWIKDYVCSACDTYTIKYPLQLQVSYESVSTLHQCYLFSIDSDIEPRSYEEAVKDKNWIEAMNNELQALEDNKTWKIVDLPKGKRPIGCKWVYKIKHKADGSVERYKARLVAKGYSQREGVDYQETFSPIVKMVTVRLVLSLAAQQNWMLHQMDVYNAFLQGDLNEEVFMTITQGLVRKGESKNKACKLNKSLYGLKQTSRQWNHKLTQALKEGVLIKVCMIILYLLKFSR